MTDNTPTIDEFRPAVLRVLSDGADWAVGDLREAVADHLRLSAEVRAERVPSGQRRYVNRINWACSALTHAKLVERPKRGRYRILPDGAEVDRRNLAEYSEKDMDEWPAWSEYQQEIRAREHGGLPRESGAGTAGSSEIDPAAGLADSAELMAAAEQSLNAVTETELRQRLQSSSPEFFEKAVIDLLWSMGYGGTHGEKQHAGRSGDGGIDGVIRQDALGLSNVYVQAKRYADTNKVGEPEIRNFIGSLDARGANQGVFITTSSFQPAAVRTAERYRHGKIVLIDGIKLTSLMLDYGVAVHKAQEFVLYKVDEDYFSEDFE